MYSQGIWLARLLAHTVVLHVWRYMYSHSIWLARKRRSKSYLIFRGAWLVMGATTTGGDPGGSLDIGLDEVDHPTRKSHGRYNARIPLEAMHHIQTHPTPYSIAKELMSITRVSLRSLVRVWVFEPFPWMGRASTKGNFSTTTSLIASKSMSLEY